MTTRHDDPTFSVHPADAEALARMAAVRPTLSGLVAAGSVIGFEPMTVLHAGAPYLPGQAPAAPVLNSAAAAAVFEGWAATRDEALHMLHTGAIRLAAAQDHRCVVPLAAVLSPSQQVQIVCDAAGVAKPAYAALNGGAGACMRFGYPGPDVVSLLRWLNGPFSDAVRPAVERGIDLLPIADQALVDGDDLHGRTMAATAGLIRALGLDGDPRPGAAAAHDWLMSSPSFFLNLWMAAVKCTFGAAEGIEGSSVVTAMGGNGVEAGLQLSARPGVWHRAPATVPVGNRVPGQEQAEALPAIGDSAVVEAFGLGAMGWAHAPAQVTALGAFMPEPAEVLSKALLSGPHPGLPLSQALFGLSGRAVAFHHKTPVVVLGILDGSGVVGRIGSGIWQAPEALFNAP